jgi:hypothetical protein
MLRPKLTDYTYRTVEESINLTHATHVTHATHMTY